MQHLQGCLIYNLCHTSSYSAASYIRSIAAYGHWSNGTTIKMRSALSAAYATCLVPWKLQGFYTDQEGPQHPIYFADASIHMVGLVFRYQGCWAMQSIPLPTAFSRLGEAARQQAAELYGILAMLRTAIRHRQFSITQAY